MVTLFITMFRWSQIDDGVVGTEGAVNDEVERGSECEAAGRVGKRSVQRVSSSTT